jgi:hypothetical protein
MSTRWFGLLLFAIWIGSRGSAHAAPQIDVSPDSPQPVDLGSVRVDNATVTTAPKQFTITNNGSNGSVLTISNITLSNSDYQLNPPVTFPKMVTQGGAPLVITVEFNPSVSGTVTANMVITSDAMGMGTKTIALTGVGTTAIISVTDVSFGIVPDGTSSSKDITVKNTATMSRGPLKVTSASISDSSGFFSFGTDPTLGCNGGTTCTFNPPLIIDGNTPTVPVVCAPPAAASGAPTATVTFASDTDPGDPTATLSCTAGRPDITVSTDTLPFNNVPVGANAVQTVTITNTGTTALTYSLSETPSLTQYVIGGCLSSCVVDPPPLPNTRTFNVTFTPTTAGLLTTQIKVSSDDPDPGDNVFTIDASGTGQAGVLTTNPASPAVLDFLGVGVGVTKTLTFTLKNSGNVPITGITGALDNTMLGYQFTATVPTTLNPNDVVTLPVTFAPQNASDGGPTTISFQGNWTVGSVSTPTAVQLKLDGDGQTIAYDVTPALAFGDFRFDLRPQLTYHIMNTAQADITVLSATFTPDAGTAPGDFGFTVTKGGVPTSPQLPQLLHGGEQLDVVVVAQPTNRIGAVSGKVTVHTSLAPDKLVTLTGNAISAGIDVPATVDFGAVDIDGQAPSRMIALANTGTAKLDILSIARVAGGSPAFTTTALPTSKVTVDPGANFPFTITYTPTTTRPSNQPETLVLDATLGGIAAAQLHAMITVQGRGIDRVFAVGAVPVFRTFRNPGDTAPVSPITVRNDGEALLKITAVMVNDGSAVAGSAVWQLVDAIPVDIPGGGTHDFLVKFLPTEVDDATHITPRGHLVLVNNDNARPMATVDLTGTCIARRVAFDKTEIDLGQIGVGIPTEVTLPVVRNMESVPFTIHSVELGDQAAFRLDTDLRDVALPASATQTLVVTLDPTAPGTLRTVARLYVDQDPTPQTELTITATAVFVDAHGSGGCAVGRGNAGGGSAIALGALIAFRAFGAFGLLGRRRPRAVRTASTAATVAAAAAMVAIAAPARAEDIGIMVFEPTPATTGSGFQLQSPDVGFDGSWAASSVVSYASNPLVLAGQGPSGPYRAAPVERSTLLELGLAYALFDRFEIGAHLPLYMQSGEVDTTAPSSVRGVEPANGTALGKLKVHAKARLWRGRSGLGELVMGASAVVVIPTASSRQYTGSDKPEGRLLLLGSFAPAALGARLAFSVNAGAIARGEAIYADIAQRSGIAWGVGASYRVLDSLWATAELFGEATPSGRREQSSTAVMPAAMLVQSEWLTGVSWRADQRFTVGIAVGRGLTDALGTPDLRGVLSIAFTQGAPAVTPIHAGDLPGSDLDSDGDGIPDSLDKCPNEPEDKDGFDDQDGCPDPDNDHDGIPDALDKCPIDPEDKDGFQDDDGCPDKDNDGDGIPDALDKCPNEPEDKDGFEDLDGCPDPDNDHDGIPDAQDKCPNEPETINGIKDDDGCPDKGDSTIVLSPDRIETLDPIPFNGLKIARAALPLLGQVAATLRAHTEIVRVRVTVHVQPSGDPDADQSRSEKRAQAVRDWLVQWGIAPARLEQRGFGGAKPLVPAGQRGAAKINDRIEFIILERK